MCRLGRDEGPWARPSQVKINAPPSGAGPLVKLERAATGVGEDTEPATLAAVASADSARTRGIRPESASRPSSRARLASVSRHQVSESTGTPRRDSPTGSDCRIDGQGDSSRRSDLRHHCEPGHGLLAIESEFDHRRCDTCCQSSEESGSAGVPRFWLSRCTFLRFWWSLQSRLERRAADAGSVGSSMMSRTVAAKRQVSQLVGQAIAHRHPPCRRATPIGRGIMLTVNLSPQVAECADDEPVAQLSRLSVSA